MKPNNSNMGLNFDDYMFLIAKCLNRRFGDNFSIALDRHLFQHFGVRLSDALRNPKRFREALRKVVSQRDSEKIEEEIAYVIRLGNVC